MQKLYGKFLGFRYLQMMVIMELKFSMLKYFRVTLMKNFSMRVRCFFFIIQRVVRFGVSFIRGLFFLVLVFEGQFGQELFCVYRVGRFRVGECLLVVEVGNVVVVFLVLGRGVGGRVERIKGVLNEFVVCVRYKVYFTDGFLL